MNAMPRAQASETCVRLIMSGITGTWKAGRVVLDQAVDWPDGRRVLVEPVPAEDCPGLREEDWSDTPEAIAQWLQWYDSLEPLEMTPAEEAEWMTWRNRIKEHTIARMNKSVEGLIE
jgi:hypothetical protein